MPFILFTLTINQWSGVRFFTLKQYLATKYPALRLDQKPKTLKRALEMGVQYGQIDLVSCVVLGPKFN